MRTFNITVNGKTYEVEVEEIRNGAPVQTAAPVTATPKAAPASASPAPKAVQASAPAGAVKVNAPMPGTILSIAVNIGDSVTEGQTLCILEAMKMENEIVAPKAGKVASIHVSKGSAVNNGDLLVSLA